ncbi:MAG: phosphohydrolase [Chloroflexi bacterium]|nr:phosphohydrolase [Chloroflexota bacterium]
MDLKSFEQAKLYALQRLEHELSPGLYYHSLEHTTQDVVPATERFAAGEGIQREDLTLLLTAAWFHDLGFIEVRVGHEAVGARLASEVLPGFGYSQAQIQVIQGIILATVVPQGPVSLLEQILADADLDVLGRDDFWSRNTALRRELAFFGKEFPDIEWFSGQHKFISTHTYFTATARALRDTGQIKSVALLQSRLAELGSGE